MQKSDRTGTGTRSVFAPQMRFDLTQGFLLVTTKKLSKSIILSCCGSCAATANVKWLQGARLPRSGMNGRVTTATSALSTAS